MTLVPLYPLERDGNRLPVPYLTLASSSLLEQHDIVRGCKICGGSACLLHIHGHVKHIQGSHFLLVLLPSSDDARSGARDSDCREKAAAAVSAKLLARSAVSPSLMQAMSCSRSQPSAVTPQSSSRCTSACSHSPPGPSQPGRSRNGRSLRPGGRGDGCAGVPCAASCMV